ncbi:MAG: hypothetical protein K6T65_10340 [Peptococcaceae bacterium]|nr:hypothetical protein [Peptococcaceae bacterium]
MVQKCPALKSGEIAMALLGEDIPAIGPRLKTRTEAVTAVKKYVSAIEGMVKCMKPCRVMFLRQPDGRYILLIKGSTETLEVLRDLDELTVKRFQKSFKNRMFIITSFYEEGDCLECLALTEGMGAVLYVP